MKARQVRPWNSSNFETFTAMTLKLQEVANFGMFFHVILFMFVYNNNKYTPLYMYRVYSDFIVLKTIVFYTQLHTWDVTFHVLPGNLSCVNTTPMSAGMLSNPHVPTTWTPAETACSWYFHCMDSKNCRKHDYSVTNIQTSIKNKKQKTRHGPII